MSYQSSIRNKKNNKIFNKTKEVKYDIDEEIEEYGIIIKMLGNCRCLITSNTNVDCVGTICGSLRKFNKRVLIEKGDVVIITRPSERNNKVVINCKLNNDQISNLIAEFKLNEKIINLYNNNCAIDETYNLNDDLTFDNSNNYYENDQEDDD